MEVSMKTAKLLGLAALILAAPGLVENGMGQSGDVRVLCSNSIRAAMVELTPQIEKATGRKLSIEFSASTALKKEIDGGAAFDLAILTPGIAADLVKSGKLAAGSTMDVASAQLKRGGGAERTGVCAV
jgi:molybdate transport system substrate-binding protein